MGLTQSDVVRFLVKLPPQHEAYQILAAYIYAKSSHGNLPTETLSKLLSIQRKLAASGAAFTTSSPLGRAFEAARSQLLAVNRLYLQKGPSAFGSLGAVGSASSPDAVIAWTKATDGKVKSFSSGGGIAVDAGRVARVVGDQVAPPIYQPPPIELANTLDRLDLNNAVEASLDPTSQEKTVEELELEQGRSTLARLRMAMLAKQTAKDESDLRQLEEERLVLEREQGSGGVEVTGVEGTSEAIVVHVPNEAPPAFDAPSEPVPVPVLERVGGGVAVV